MRLVALAAVLTASADARWLKLESEPFTVYTDAGEKAGQEVLRRLDLARRALGGPLPLPVTAYVFNGGAQFRALRIGDATRGFYQSAPDRDYIVVDATAGDLGRVAGHEFSHLVLNHTSGPLPLWLEEGLAEFHSTLEATGGKLRLGKPVEQHLRLLLRAPLLSADELTGVRKDSRLYDEAGRAGVFYAQSWAMAHMLRLDGRYRQNTPAFLRLLDEGETQPAAFQRAYGKSPSEAVRDLKGYVEGASLPVLDVAMDAGDAAGSVRATTLSDWDGALAYAEIALATGRIEEAERVYGKLSRTGARTSREAAALGMLALARKRTDEAKQLLKQAIELPNAEGSVYFEYAMLIRDTGGSRAETRKYLLQAVERNPRHAEALFLLGAADAAEGGHDAAIRYLERATAVLPRQSYFWHGLSLSYHSIGRSREARQAAQRALESAVNSEQVEMARAAVRLAGQEVVGAEKRPAVNTPESWRNPQGDRRVEGVLERIDCLGESARFVIRASGKPLALLVENPGQVLLKNASSITFEFRCGEQKPRAVVVEYKDGADKKLGAAGVVTSIEFP